MLRNDEELVSWSNRLSGDTSLGAENAVPPLMLRTVTMASTMGPGIKVDPTRLKDLNETEAGAAA